MLIDYDALSAINQKSALLGDEGQSSEIYVLLFDVVNGTASGRLIGRHTRQAGL